jgi:hypothetical protein
LRLKSISIFFISLEKTIYCFFIYDEYGTVQILTGLRVMVTLADGNVAYDTAKSNSFSNFLAKSINENHNSRVSIMSALLGNLGMRYEVKYSTTDSYKEAYHDQRMGPSSHNTLGCIRVSVISV